MLDWKQPELLNEVQEGEVIIIAHSRGTWHYPQDLNRIRCVVVFRRGDRFKGFGPDIFDVSEISQWAKFNPPNC